MVRSRVTLAIFIFLESSLLIFDPRLVFLVLLVFVDEVARGYNF
jgi:hypothetical protein